MGLLISPEFFVGGLGAGDRGLGGGETASAGRRGLGGRDGFRNRGLPDGARDGDGAGAYLFVGAGAACRAGGGDAELFVAVEIWGLERVRSEIAFVTQTHTSPP